MKHIIVNPPSGANSRLSKGFVLADDSNSLNDLKRRLEEEFKCPVDGVAVVKKDGTRVEVADMDFIRDDDTLCILRDGDLDDKKGDDATAIGEPFVRLNVGGRIFLTCRSTLLKSPSCMLARMLAVEDQGRMAAGRRDTDGAIVIDRSSEYFQPILNFLRTGKVVLDEGVNPEGVFEEAKFYGIEELLSPLSDLMQSSPWSNSGGLVRPLGRKEVISATLATPTDRELRFQGVDMAGADLSRLDLRHINFKYANLKGSNLCGANLSWCSLERADLSGAKLDGAQLLGVKMLCANLESASLIGCNFDDPCGSNANMEGVNLRSAVLEGSNMARINLRVATIKHGNLKNCDLRAAVLAGADLEFCDLSGSDLGEANLRGANLKDTTLELMQTPLHMSQTIR